MFDPPTQHHELVRHYTLSEADLAPIRRCRGDHNRLGHALMLCYLRHPGRPLRAGERPPEPLLAFVAEQIDVLPETVDTYLAAERNRVCHSAEVQNRLRLRPFGTRPAALLSTWLLPYAVEDDRLVHLAGLVLEECRRRRIDRGAVLDGTAATGKPWQHYDLGHGYCSYTFFEQCPHRMACARCDFYIPKPSGKAQLLEAKADVDRRLALIPLTDGGTVSAPLSSRTSKRWASCSAASPIHPPRQARRRAKSPGNHRILLVSHIPHNARLDRGF